MSTGGYKLVKFSWVGGRTDSELYRTNFVLTGIIDAIINSGTGWTLDSDWGMTTTSDYKTLKVYTYSSTVYGVNIAKFLKSPTGNRVLIGYASRISYFHNDDLIEPTVTYSQIMGLAPNGLYFSMINNVIDNWIEDTTYGIRIPNSALRITSFGNSNTYANYTNYSFVYENTSNTVYTYGILLKSGMNQICIYERSSDWTIGLIKCFLVGDIIKLLAHNTDNYYLCCINLSNNVRFASSSQYERESNPPQTNTSTSSTDFGFINQETSYTTTYNNNKNQCQIFDATGKLYFGSKSLTEGKYTIIYGICNTRELSTYVCLPNITGGSRWTPVEILIYSSNPASMGVIEGDGFKGYLDTDVIRGVTIGQYSRGQLFGNDNDFIYVGGGIALGWDSNNTESIF